MELLSGMDMDDYIRSAGPISPKRLIPMFVNALDALGMAHQLGITHKDLKPSNLFLSNPGARAEAIRIVDFGIAHIKNPHAIPGEEDEGERLTGTGQIFGTLQYLAPEYISHQVVTPALDVYQMGLILIELLCGKPVIRTSNPMDCLRIHTFGLLEIPKYLKHSELLPILSVALAADHELRYQDASAFADALSKLDPKSLPDAPDYSETPLEWARMLDEDDDDGVHHPSTAEQRRPTTEQLRLENQRASTEQGATSIQQIKPQARPTVSSTDPLTFDPPAGSGNEKKLLIALLIAIGLAGAVAAFLLGNKTKPAEEPVPEPIAQTPPKPEKIVEPPPEPQKKPDPPPAPLPRVQITTEPAGATVWRDDKRLGLTPYEFLYTEDERDLFITLTLELDQYKKTSVELDPTRLEPIALTLEPIPKKVRSVTKKTPKQDTLMIVP
jgi:serine/threonine protein kinase